MFSNQYFTIFFIRLQIETTQILFVFVKLIFIKKIAKTNLKKIVFKIYGNIGAFVQNCSGKSSIILQLLFCNGAYFRGRFISIVLQILIVVNERGVRKDNIPCVRCFAHGVNLISWSSSIKNIFIWLGRLYYFPLLNPLCIWFVLHLPHCRFFYTNYFKHFLYTTVFFPCLLYFRNEVKFILKKII